MTELARDLFGHVAPYREPVAPGIPRRKVTKAAGYAAEPGSGPAGETCRTCRHYTHRTLAKRYRKCGLMAHAWTRGPGSDILARSPACNRWEANP